MATEDFTTYTEVDPGSDITITEDRVSWDLVPNPVVGYVYDDKGAGHFDGDFEHRFKLYMSSTNTDYYSLTCAWGLSTSIGNYKAWLDDSSDAASVRVRRTATLDYYIQFYLVEAGSSTGDVWDGPAGDTTYYCTVDRDDDGGANSTGLYTLYVCTGNYYGETGATLQDTMTNVSSSGEQNDFRYVYGQHGYGYNESYYESTGWLEDLDLQESISASPSASISASLSASPSRSSSISASPSASISASPSASISASPSSSISASPSSSAS